MKLSSLFQKPEPRSYKIIRALVDGSELSAFQLSEATKLSSADLYPVLFFMEDEEYLTSRWADEPYPRRRLYKIAPRKKA